MAPLTSKRKLHVFPGVTAATAVAAAEAIVDLMEGRTPGLLVNPEVLDQPQLRASKPAPRNS